MRKDLLVISLVIAVVVAALVVYVGMRSATPTGENGKNAPDTSVVDSKNGDSKSGAVDSPVEAAKTKTNSASKKGKTRKVRKIAVHDDEMKTIMTVMDEFGKSRFADRRVKLLEELYGINHPKVIKIVLEALKDENEDVRLEAVALLEDFESADVLPAVQKALGDKSAEVRLTAINSLMEVDSPDATNLLVRATSDRSEDVREVVFDIIEERHPQIQEIVFEQAIKSTHVDVKEKVVNMIIDIPSHNVMNILIEGLKDKNEDFREEVNGVIDFFVSEEFESYEDAKKWWEQNKKNFDEELFEK